MSRIRIYLADADRERLGYTEPLEMDFLVLMQLEAEVLQKEVPAFDPDDWGGFLSDSKGPHFRHVLVWLALRRNGIKLPYAEVDFDRRSFGIETLDVEPEGKDDSSTPDRTSNSNGDATSPSSPTSSDSSPSALTVNASAP